MGDNVNHPDHYCSGGIECIDAMIAAHGVERVECHCTESAFKYIWRFMRKGGDEDIEKAVWYLQKYLELRRGETE